MHASLLYQALDLPTQVCRGGLARGHFMIADPSAAQAALGVDQQQVRPLGIDPGMGERVRRVQDLARRPRRAPLHSLLQHPLTQDDESLRTLVPAG
jgi:hypothetical protein